MRCPVSGAITITTCSIIACALSGCAFHSPAPEPVAHQPAPRSAWPSGPFVYEPDAPGGDPATGRHDTFSFQGDDPEYDHVPFENRSTVNATRHTFTTDGLDFDPDLDASGDTLVYASTRNAVRPDIYIKSVDGTAVTQLTSDPADDIQPRFSPDGTQVVFCSNRSGNWDIWVINRDGTGLRQLTRQSGDEIAPCWSPDGQQIAFTAWIRPSRRWEIWSLDVGQPGIRRLLTHGMFPSWSPDGQQIAFQRARQRGSRWFSVWTVDLIDGEARYPTEIAHSDTAACIAPRWAPDGESIVYCEISGAPPAATAMAGHPYRASLWVVDLRDGGRYRVTNGQSPSFNPIWASTGRIFFVAAREGGENIWSVSGSVTGYAATNRQDQVTRATGQTQPAE